MRPPNTKEEVSKISNHSYLLGFAELFLQSMADYEDADNNKLDGYHLAGLTGYYALPVGQVNFGIENLFNTVYETIWSQRAQVLYGTISAPELFRYNGQGRTFALSYSAKF